MSTGASIKPMSMVNMVTGAAYSGGPPPEPEPPPPGPDPAQAAEQQMKAERSQLQNQKLKDDMWVRRLEQLEKRQSNPSSRMDRAMKGLDLIKGTAQKLQIKRAAAPLIPEPVIPPHTGPYVAPPSSVQPTSKWQLAKDIGKGLFGRPMWDSAKNFMADPEAGVQPLVEATVGAPGAWRDTGNATWNAWDQRAKKYEPGTLESGLNHMMGATLGNLSKGTHLATQTAGNWLAHGLMAPAATLARGAWNTGGALLQGGVDTALNLANNGLNAKITPQLAEAGSNLWSGARDMFSGGSSLAMNLGPGKLFKGLGILQDGAANAWGTSPASAPPAPAPAPQSNGGGIMDVLGPVLASITGSLGSIMGDNQTAPSILSTPSGQGPLSTTNNRLIYG